MEICRVPSPGLTQAPWDIHPAHLCRFTVRSPEWLTLPQLFSEVWNHPVSGAKSASSSPLGVVISGLWHEGLLGDPPTGLNPGPCGHLPLRGWTYPPPSLLQEPSLVAQEYSPASHQLRLSASPKEPANPGKISFTQEPLGLRRWGFSPHLSLTHACISSCGNSTAPCRYGFAVATMLPYRLKRSAERSKPAASVLCLSPVTFLAQGRLTSELLRFL